MRLLDYENCCGCGCCYKSCPFKAINMIETKEGFLIPQIDSQKCRKCGICEKKCPVLNCNKIHSNEYDYFAAYSKNKETLLKSSSGGLFYEIAKYFIKHCGIVYGVSMYKNKVKHIKVTNLEELEKILKSKYLQSNAFEVFDEIKDLLKNNKNVLFAGTPCQVEALKSFLEKDYENLFTIDFICTGIPSKKVFDSYIKHFENKYNKRLSSVDFRNKMSGWYNYSFIIKFKNKKIKKSRFFAPLNYLHYNHYSVMKKCLKCDFREGKSISDIQLGDFWNSYLIDNKIYNKNGVSAVILKTKKGRELFEQIKNCINYFKVSKDDLIRVNKSYSSINIDDNNRKQFFSDFIASNNKYSIIKKYSNISFKNRIIISVNLLKLKIKGR